MDGQAKFKEVEVFEYLGSLVTTVKYWERWEAF